MYLYLFSLFFLGGCARIFPDKWQSNLELEINKGARPLTPVVQREDFFRICISEFESVSPPPFPSHTPLLPGRPLQLPPHLFVCLINECGKCSEYLYNVFLCLWIFPSIFLIFLTIFLPLLAFLSFFFFESSVFFYIFYLFIFFRIPIWSLHVAFCLSFSFSFSFCRFILFIYFDIDLSILRIVHLVNHNIWPYPWHFTGLFLLLSGPLI